MPHRLTYRQTEYTFGLVAAALGKEEPDGQPSVPLQRICDDLLEASIPDPCKDASASLAADWTDMESFSRPPPAKGGPCAAPEASWVRAAVEPGRSHALNKAAFHLGHLIAAGALPEDLACTELYDAASVHFGVGTPPFTPADARATIRSGITAGKRKPRPLATRGAAA